MLEKLKKIYSFLYEKAYSQEQKLESDFFCLLQSDLIYPEKRLKIDKEMIPLEEIRDCFNRMKIPFNNISTDDMLITDLNDRYDIAFRCVNCVKYHYPNRNEDGYAVEKWFFAVDQLLESPQERTPHHLDLSPEVTIGEVIFLKKEKKKKMNGNIIMHAIKNFKKEEIEPTYNTFLEELELKPDDLFDALLLLRSMGKIDWDSNDNSIEHDDLIYLVD